MQKPDARLQQVEAWGRGLPLERGRHGAAAKAHDSQMRREAVCWQHSSMARSVGCDSVHELGVQAVTQHMSLECRL